MRIDQPSTIIWDNIYTKTPDYELLSVYHDWLLDQGETRRAAAIRYLIDIREWCRIWTGLLTDDTLTTYWHRAIRINVLDDPTDWMWAKDNWVRRAEPSRQLANIPNPVQAAIEHFLNHFKEDSNT